MKARALRVTVLFLTPVILCARAGAQEPQWLQYRWDREARRVAGETGYNTLALSGDKPQDVNLPELTGENPFFTRWPTPMVKSGYLWIVLDRSHRYGPYDRLYIDSNADGNLADETAQSAYKVERENTSFGPVKVLLEGEDGPVTYHLNFDFHGRRRNPCFHASSAGWYEGTIIIDGQKKTCAITDRTVNGTFNDKSDNFHKSDRIRIGTREEGFTRFVGNYIEIEGVLYRPQIARDGAYIKITKAEDVTFGTVRLPLTIAEFSAGGDNGLLYVAPKDGVGRLPVGKYRIHDWQIERRDDKGTVWQLKGERFPETGDFVAAEANQTNLAIGEPVVSKLEARQRDSGEYYFRQELQGQLGERIELARSGDRPKPPRLHVKSADGKYDKTFSFEYG